MGTSISYRSPNVPRWNVVIARILNDDEPRLIQAELFNAGTLDGWANELGRPAISHFVEAVVEAHEGLAGALRQAESPELAVQDLADAVRQKALAEEGAPAVAVAERAFARTLLQTIHGEPTADRPAEPAETWTSQRGRVNDLVQRFLGEVLHQYAAHVVARDAGRLAGQPGFEKASSLRKLERDLADQARAVAQQVPVEGSPSEIVARWRDYVGEAFRLAATLPHNPDD